MNREDFEILNTGIIYFDNGATTLKPKQVVDSIVDYYTKYTANAHRGDYDNSLKVDMMYESVRTKVRKFINCKRDEEIVFTAGSTDSLNRIVFGFRITSDKDYTNKACKAVYKQMRENNTLNPRARYYINKENDKIEFGLKDADTHEQLMFIKNVKQVLNLNSDSRYIIKYGRQIFTVPDEFSKNNEMANSFRKKLKFIGKSDLIYTKSEKGREKLLEYRLRYFNKD